MRGEQEESDEAASPGKELRLLRIRTLNAEVRVPARERQEPLRAVLQAES